jgi:hypothetical protein
MPIQGAKMTSKVFRHKPLAADELLGRVEPDGRLYESRFGPDKYIGRVETDNGKIYEAHVGPDKYVGRVELDTGKVFRARPGPDVYVGRVTGDGEFRRHKPVAADEYIGKVTEMASYAHGGAAFLLLALPAWEEAQATAVEAKAAPPVPPAEA